MVIHTEETPNANALKFILGRVILTNHQGMDFPNKESATQSPLALALFDLDGVDRVFFGQDFIVIAKTEDVVWKPLRVAVISLIMDFLLTRKIIVHQEHSSDTVEMETAPEDVDMVERIKIILDAEVRPAVARDGGDIIFYGYKKGCVYLKMQGACQGCPSSALTLKLGVETILRRHLPEITTVEKVDA